MMAPRARPSFVLIGLLVTLLLAAGCAATASGPAAPPRRPDAPARTTGSTPRPDSPADTSARIDRTAQPGEVLARIGDVPVLAYHQIRPWRPGDSEQARAYIMPPQQFRAQMDYLDEHGFHTVSPDQLLAHLTTGAALPPEPVLLTFDDSDANQFTNALPVLRRHGFTATFFIMTVVLGNEHYMTDKQLRTLDDAGMTIGLHTWDHHRVDRYSGDDWTKQIVEPTKELEQVLDHRIRYFAYPYGAWDAAAFSHLRKNGYWAAFQLTGDPVSTTAPLYTLQRMIANPYWDLDDFAAHLAPAQRPSATGNRRTTGN